ncbi:MAG: hypothetical protein WD029_05945 [Microthrixaceae bacterium]
MSPALSAAHLQIAGSESDPSSRLSMAIAGLLLLALIVLIATIIFWRLTRPDERSESVDNRSVR